MYLIIFESIQLNGNRIILDKIFCKDQFHYINSDSIDVYINKHYGYS